MACSFTSRVGPMSATMYPEASGKSNPCKAIGKLSWLEITCGTEAVEVLVPLREPAVEDRGVGDQHRLVMVGRGQHGLAAEPQHDLGTVPAKYLGQGNPRLERIEQPAVGQVQVHPHGDSQDLGGLASLGQPDVGPGRMRRRLAVGQVNDANAVALAHQPGQRSAAGDLDVVGMQPHRDQIEFLLCLSRTSIALSLASGHNALQSTAS